MWIPSRRVEYLYYFTIAYTILSSYFGVEIPLLAAGMTVALALYCVRNLGSRAKEILAPMAFLFACLISFIFVQVAVHGASITEQSIRTFVLSICEVIIVRSLCLRRGFLYRCTLVLVIIAVIPLRNLGFSESTVEMARIDAPVAGNLSHPSGLAWWFGFCAIFFAVAGLEEKRGNIQILYWAGAVGCLAVVALTVERGPVVASALAITVAFRRLLKRGFLPVLLLMIFAGVILVSGLFDRAAGRYQERGTEETGRFLLWPVVVERILAAPLTGVGADNIATDLREGRSISTPHNSFLYFGLTSGVIPLAFYALFWMRVVWRSLSSMDRTEYSPFQSPFLLYMLVGSMLGELVIANWSTLALSVAASVGIPRQTGRVSLVRKIPAARTAAPLQHP
jgi:O-Antigen ligase